MCGIIGKVGPDHHDALPLDHLSHRGPDAAGRWTNGRNCTLGHTRLSILDLDERANQPMTDPSGRFTIVYNGEIYNYLELRRQYLPDESLHTTSDSEVLLLLWRKMGSDCLTLLRGMYAFAIWDDHDNKLWMARDRFGQKPLVYTSDGRTLTFASELQALRQCIPQPQLEPKAIDLFLGYQFIPAPYTINRDVFKLPPAHYAVWDGRSLSVSRYWKLQFAPAGSATISEPEAADILQQKIRQAVRYRLRADVPVGCLLSGGVDSGLITAMAAEEASSKIMTFTIGFKEDRYDERDYARQVAQRYGTDHRCYELSMQKSEDYLDKAIQQYGEPFGDSSALPTLMVCEHASRDVKVALTGDGGDELLAGYSFLRLSLTDRFFHSAMRQRYQLGRTIGRARCCKLRSRLLDKFLKRLSAFVSPLNRSLIYERYVRQHDRLMLYQDDFFDQVAPLRHDYQQSLLDEVDFATYPLNQLLAIHYNGYFANDLLVKTDIAGMAFGLELRAPLLDHELMEFAATLPPEMKFRQRTGKYLLKKVAAKYLPENLLNRHKRGFSVPVADWTRTHYNTHIRDMAGTVSHPIWQYLNRQTVTKWMDQHERRRGNHGKRLWLILLLGLWLEKQ